MVGFPCGDGPTRVGVEFVKSRRVLRLFGWCDHHEGRVTPAEVPLRSFLEQVGVPDEALGLSPRFLLFAGSHRRPRGGYRDLVAGFDAEDRAREVFRRLRLTRQPDLDWAELVALEPGGRLKPLCWFGVRAAAVEPHPGGWALGDDPPPAPAPHTEVTSRRGRLRRLLAAPALHHSA
jgi:hypothetical protein